MVESLNEVVVEPRPGSGGRLTFSPGSSLTLWTAVGTATEPGTKREFKVKIASHRPVVIGRAEGHDVPYLDPAYRATRVVPGTGQSVLRGAECERDDYVSRGHFMLRADPAGIVLVNGVPSPGGAIRPPTNGTRFCSPAARPLDPEEAYLIGHGEVAVFRLPNGAEIRIDAE